MKLDLIKDKNGKCINEGDLFTFMYLKELHNPIKLCGAFTYNDDELRYEIDIFESDEYTCLSYLSNGMMYNFELILF